MNRSWYPGHMAKALEDIKKHLNIIDIVIEVADSRVPVSSRDVALDRLVGRKQRIIVLNKADLSDNRLNTEWIKYFESNGMNAIAINAKSSRDIERLKGLMKNIDGRYKDRRIKNIVIVGIPNVGKSTILNALSGNKRAAVGARPGITKRIGWFRTDEFQIMDTPGILKPNIKNELIKLHLACIGAIDDAAIDIEDMAMGLLEVLMIRYVDRLIERYGIPYITEQTDNYELLKMICRNKSWLKSGGEPDTYRGAAKILDDFRKGLLGPVTLEFPPEDDNVE